MRYAGSATRCPFKTRGLIAAAFNAWHIGNTHHNVKLQLRKNAMRSWLARFTLAVFGTAAFATTVWAQASTPCVNDAPNPYRLVTNWATTPRPWSHPLADAVDSKDNLWAFDRCEEAGCAESKVSPIFELDPNGKTIRNFGAGLFVFPHGIKVDREGNVWAVDGNAKNGKGMQAIKLSPDGNVLMTLGKAGQGAGSAALDTFNQPTDIAIASNGDIFVAEGHSPTFGNSRIVKFDKSGKFIKTFGKLGSGDGELKEPHAIAIDSHDRLFVADRYNSRVVIFDKDGNFVAAWKQFGRPSGVWIDRNDMLYAADSQSSDDPKSPNYNASCKQGIRVGSVKDGKVTAFIPPVTNSKLPPPEGIAVDSHGTIYAAAQQQNDVLKYVKD
jgi:sugar lactone lactonase YvrE